MAATLVGGSGRSTEMSRSHGLFWEAYSHWGDAPGAVRSHDAANTCRGSLRQRARFPAEVHNRCGGAAFLCQYIRTDVPRICGLGAGEASSHEMICRPALRASPG